MKKLIIIFFALLLPSQVLAQSVSGATIGTSRITTPIVHPTIRKIRRRGPPAFCGAALGTATPGSAAPPFVATSTQATVATTTVCGLP